MLDSEYIKTLVKKAAEFGNGKINIIVNNAGSANANITHSSNIINKLADIHGMVLYTRYVT